ncbi:MAG TPA: branched-chain amino acid ABC transporter permease [Thermodesulfobacteriota bacterium]|nr:branched-chain amino acid ABC transporter permease [Thermodesulfobacteriota bacterium]
MLILTQLVNGITQGSIYALIAIGFVIIFGTMNLVTFAHGEVYMMGAFMGYFALTLWNLPWYVGLAMGMGAAWTLGFLIEKIAFRPLRTAGHMPPLLITIGLSIILKDLAVILFGAENRPVPSIFGETIKIAGLQISLLQALILVLAGGLILVLRLLIQGTKIGRAMRATAEDPEAAYAMGVDINRVFSISFCLASCLGGAAGVLVGIYYNAVYPVMGDTAGLKGFAACIFGGLTSIPGAILGGLIIGVVENLTVQFIASGYRDIVAFLVLVIVLVIRPQGILGKKIRAV